jgi:hypothetical protein
MNKRFSSLSNANCYEDLRGKECVWENIIGPTAGTYDVIENDYYSRSIINDKILKKKHILFLGDSFVFGHGVAHVDSMGIRFEELLNNDEYCIINLGVPGASYERSFLRLQQWCNQFGDNIHSVYFGLTHPFRTMYVLDYAMEDFQVQQRTQSMDLKDKLKYVMKGGITFDNLYDKRNQIKIDNVGWVIINRDEIEDLLIDQTPYAMKSPPYDNGDIVLAHRAFYKYTACRSTIDILTQWDRQVAMLKTQGKAYQFNTCTFLTATPDISPLEHETIKQHADVLEGFPKFTYCLQEVSDDKLGEGHHIDPINNRHWNILGNKQVAINLFKETKHWYDKKSK